METNIWLVICSETEPDYPDPDLTPKGYERIKLLRTFLPQNTSGVVVGTGKRHDTMRAALKLKATLWTPIVGGPETRKGKKVVLASGRKIYSNAYKGEEDLIQPVIELLASLKHDSVVCTDKINLYLLLKTSGLFEVVKPHSVYKVTVVNGLIAKIQKIG